MNHRSQNSSTGIVTSVGWTSKDSGFDCRYGLDTASGHTVERYRRAGGRAGTPRLMQFEVNAISDLLNLKKVKSEIITFLKLAPDFSIRERRRNYMTMVEENCWAAALISLSTALSCCLECLLIILTGERLSDKHSGGPAGKRQTCELDFKINKLKECANGQTPTSLLREFDLLTSAVKTMLDNRERFSAGVAFDSANLLILWMEDRIQNNVPLSLMAIQAEAGSCLEVAKATHSDPEVKFMASGVKTREVLIM